MDKEAEIIPIGCEKLIYLPYLMGERTSYLDHSCRGVFFGLSAIPTKAHILRSVMEGVSYSMCDCVEILRGMGIFPDEMLIRGGGATSSLWMHGLVKYL